MRRTTESYMVQLKPKSRNSQAQKRSALQARLWQTHPWQIHLQTHQSTLRRLTIPCRNGQTLCARDVVSPIQLVDVSFDWLLRRKKWSLANLDYIQAKFSIRNIDNRATHAPRTSFSPSATSQLRRSTEGQILIKSCLSSPEPWQKGPLKCTSASFQTFWATFYANPQRQSPFDCKTLHAMAHKQSYARANKITGAIADATPHERMFLI